MAGCRRSYLSDYSESEYDSEPASDEDDDAMERAADRFEAIKAKIERIIRLANLSCSVLVGQ